MKGWRTIATNLAVLAVAAVSHFTELPEVSPAVVATIVALINVLLRFVTTTPVGDKI